MRRALGSLMVALCVAVPSVGSVAHASGGPQRVDPNPAPQIVGGVATTTTTYPWMAAILHTEISNPFDAQFCGGTLIDPRYVLTAAHCLTNQSLTAGDVQVVLGRTNLDDITVGDRRAVSAIATHPMWNPATSEFDLALLTLSTPALGIPTAAFANDTASEGLNQPGVILGWGVLDSGATQFTSILHAGGVKVLAPPSGAGSTTCGSYNAAVFFPASEICAGVSQTGGIPDNYLLDDGGPLVVGNPGGWRVIGVTTEIGPGGIGNPSLYARVSAGAAWINTFVVAPTDVGTYHAISPVRLVDTRNNTGNLGSGVVGGQWSINPQIASWPTSGVPLTGAVAVVVNVTVTQPSTSGWLTVWPTGSPFPTASNLNFVAGQTVANLVTVKLGQAGKISISNTGGSFGAGPAHIIVDLMGWYGDDDTGALFHPMAPNRLVDTRVGTTDNPALNSAVTNTAPITPTVCGGTTGVDASASAVVVNATVVSGSTAGHLTLWPTGSAPAVSNLNYTAGQTVANLAIAKVGPGCTIKVGNSPGAFGRAPIAVILDVVGWFGQENVADGGGHLHAMAPRRIVDTRTGTVDNPRVGALAPQETYAPIARGIGPVSSGAVAVIVNLTATKPTSKGWLTLFPTGAVPTASNLNFLAGKTVPNLAIVQVHSDDKVRVNNTFGYSLAGTVHVVMDEMGWFE